ncbi:MAG: CapA family protein [Anaerolineales bacterium]|nr:CapA family protein [Anaerolineales bacterium]
MQKRIFLRKIKPVIILIAFVFASGCLVNKPTSTPVVPTGIITEITILTPTLAEPIISSSTTITPTTEPTEIPITRILFTGVIVPARCVQAAIDEREDTDYIYAEVKDIIQSADLAVGTLNSGISDYPDHTGCIRTYVLVGESDNANAMARAGFDLMSVATNHIKNCGIPECGDIAFLDTLENLENAGIQYVGAGINHQAAMLPVVITVNGIRFGFVSLGQIEETAFAGEDTPGIAILNEENLRTAIEKVSLISDVVIVMPHWGPEDVPNPNWSQKVLAKVAVDAGADLVVGNHTHVIQAYHEINGVPVFYGLGNFVFDQDLPDHQQGMILIVTFEGTEITGFDLIPTHVDRYGTVYLADETESAEIFGRIEEANQNLPGK